MVVPGKRRKGRPRRTWIDNYREDMSKYELTADMTENRQYWRMMVKTGPLVEMVSKGERSLWNIEYCSLNRFLSLLQKHYTFIIEL